jgi:hypothetical protein
MPTPSQFAGQEWAFCFEGVLPHAEAARQPEAGRDVARGHDDDYRHGFASSNEIVKNSAGSAHSAPEVVCSAAAVKEIEHRQA